MAAFMFPFAFVLASLTPSASLKADVTPTEKVIELLNGMVATVQNESAAEAATYETFACFCKDKTDALSSSIATGKTSIDTLSAEIELKNATKGEKSTEMQEAKVSLEAAKAKLKETEVRAEKERAEYQANDADISKAISSLGSAITSLSSSRPSGSFLTLKHAVPKEDPAVAEAMRLLDAGPAWKINTALLQTGNSVDPNDPAYKFHSRDIVATMQQLHDEFSAKKVEADQEYVKAKAASDKMISDLNAEIGTTTDSISTLDTEIAALTTRLAEARQELVEADAALKDDNLYLKDLTSLCETRAKQWDQRFAMRADELKALTDAVGILTSVVQGKSQVNMRALLQSSLATPPSFLQRAEVKEHTVASDEQRAAESEHTAASLQEEHRVKALELLGQEGRRLNSRALTAMVAQAASDPFAKIKTMIQGLVERLLKEATDEATKKGFCDKEMGKATSDRDFRLEEVMTLNSEISELEAKQSALELEMDDLSTRLQELADVANETALLREQDHAENMRTLADAKEGLDALMEAMGILKTFYKQAAKAAVLSQAHASPVDEENPGAGFDAAYTGKQADSKGVIGLLEVIQSDFERTIKTTEEEEKKAAAEYVEFDRSTKMEQGAKTTKHELDAEDLETTRIKKQKCMDDMQANMNLLDSALVELEELAPLCVNNVMSYEERVAKREQEVAALRRALCILDPEGVEAECQTARL